MAGLLRTFDQIQNPIIWLIHCRQPDLVQSVTIAFGLRYLGLAFFFFPLSLFLFLFFSCISHTVLLLGGWSFTWVLYRTGAWSVWFACLINWYRRVGRSGSRIAISSPLYVFFLFASFFFFAMWIRASQLSHPLLSLSLMGGPTGMHWICSFFFFSCLNTHFHDRYIEAPWCYVLLGWLFFIFYFFIKFWGN